MPTYTYACKQCQHRFDVRQSFADPALTDCPRCSGRLRKVLNSVGIVFKGSGFYRTDSRNSQASAPAGSAAGKAAAVDKAAADKSAGAGAGGRAAAPDAPKAKAKQPAAVA
jgi:putative FmdB family regulatory protein